MVECAGSELLHEDVVDVVADAPAVVSAPELPENVVS